MGRREVKPSQEAPPSTLVEELCSRFESELRSGRRPQIEAYLAQVPNTAQHALIHGLLPIELRHRASRGERVVAEEYVRRLPEHEALVSTICGSVGRSEGAEVPMSDVVLAPGERAPAQALPVSPDDALARTWPFSELPPSIVEEIRSGMAEHEFDVDEVLIQQGEPGRGLWLVFQGQIEVGVEEEGSWRGVAEPGGAVILGEMSLVTDQPCTATVVATTPGRALLLPADRFRQIAARHSVLWVALSRLIAERLGRLEVDVLAGKLLHGYRIRRAVGRGGMAVVYEAEDEAGRGLGRVALKMMSHRLVHDLEAQGRFEREVQICQGLDHPNITRIHQCFTSFGTNFMVMEFCDGASLAEIIRRRGALRQEQVRRVAGQLAAALHHAHESGVCHRDLKPGNVMVDRQGTLKLMDFGLARHFSDAEITRAGDVLGTPRYMPPEQLTGKQVDFRADLFAFGCIVYELLTGKPLFEGTDLMEIVAAQLQWKLPPAARIRPRLDPDLHRLLRQTLGRRPEDRVVDLGAVAAWSKRLDPSLLSFPA